MKVKVEIDIKDIFNSITSKEVVDIADSIIAGASDDALIEEVLERGLASKILNELNDDEFLEIYKEFF